MKWLHIIQHDLQMSNLSFNRKMIYMALLLLLLINLMHFLFNRFVWMQLPHNFCLRVFLESFLEVVRGLDCPPWQTSVPSLQFHWVPTTGSLISLSAIVSTATSQRPMCWHSQEPREATLEVTRMKAQGTSQCGFVEVLAAQQSPDNPKWFQVSVLINSFFLLNLMLILKYSLAILSLHSCWYLLDVKFT